MQRWFCGFDLQSPAPSALHQAGDSTGDERQFVKDFASRVGLQGGASVRCCPLRTGMANQTRSTGAG